MYILVLINRSEKIKADLNINRMVSRLEKPEIKCSICVKGHLTIKSYSKSESPLIVDKGDEGRCMLFFKFKVTYSAGHG